ncbi:MAG: hypothetical protein PHY09_03130 [Desulfuromonadaceae bacterium]|nr:hypothetical protein [Desulfuromonadaceae bacterium]MDD5104487.1 hypothetical protein [Desulfuromonadaceae bacterium]
MNNQTYAEIARKMRQLPLEKNVLSYEWEELVEKMCAADDSSLRTIGLIELEELKRSCTERI